MKASLQALFDKALQRVTKQGCISTNGNNGCLYRGPAGLKCAVGHLMTNKQMKKYGIDESKAPGQFPKALLNELAPQTKTKDVEEFLYALRSAHDNVSDDGNFADNYRSCMLEVAIVWKLKMP